MSRSGTTEYHTKLLIAWTMVGARLRKHTAREFLMPWLPMPLSLKPSAVEKELLGEDHMRLILK